MEIKTLNHNDVSLLVSLQPDGWQDITLNFNFYTKVPFCFPIKVIIEGEIVGVGAAIIHSDVAWLGHIIVHPAYRSNGIGNRITQALITISMNNKCETIYLIATELGAPVYQKLGFITETEYLFFKDIIIAPALAISTNIEPYQKRFKRQIAIIDKLNSGEDRMFHLENYLKQGHRYCKNNTTEGYYMPTFGDGLIIANTISAGIALLNLHLSTNDKVTFPKENQGAMDFLYGKGYKEARTARRMRFGKYIFSVSGVCYM
ncbi:hypothetical protein Dfri01_21590 [Dyadobacter frigoris]|uniref:GNAT family N-acetyltransferase n=1 Tax=Dyadobacter frigoris TaxID=2576211 RepID=UPI0024A3CE2F|nr:GNAT family N-acetyltransferase [Dyadobacter frigoris]GLU52698.1 hypothetical protein Dfri01_21590 [Dyadobacter frigoris]